MLINMSFIGYNKACTNRAYITSNTNEAGSLDFIRIKRGATEYDVFIHPHHTKRATHYGSESVISINLTADKIS